MKKIIKQFKFSIKNAKGFTLIETLVAVLILSGVLTGLIVISSQGIFNGSLVQQRIIAQYLAQEGVELIRAQRDTYSIVQDSWIGDPENVVYQECVSTDGCMIDVIDILPIACDDQCELLKYNEDLGTYWYGDGEKTIFLRIIFLEEISSGGFEVNSIVEWKRGSETKSIEYKEYLFDWI